MAGPEYPCCFSSMTVAFLLSKGRPVPSFRSPVRKGRELVSRAPFHVLRLQAEMACVQRGKAGASNRKFRFPETEDFLLRRDDAGKWRRLPGIRPVLHSLFTPELPDRTGTGSAAKKGCLSHGCGKGSRMKEAEKRRISSGLPPACLHRRSRKAPWSRESFPQGRT